MVQEEQQRVGRLLHNLLCSCQDHSDQGTLKMPQSSNGELRKSELALDVSLYQIANSLRDSVARAESVFALSVLANFLSYTWEDAAASMYLHIFLDYEVARGFRTLKLQGTSGADVKSCRI